MVYSKNKTKDLILQYSSKLNIPTVTENKYTGLHTFPVEYQYTCEDNSTILQKYSDSSCFKITSGRTSRLILSDVGCINLTKKKLYGFYTVCLYEHYQYYIQVKDIVSMIDKIIQDSRSKSFFLITKSNGIVITPVSEEIADDVDYEFYSSFFFWYVTLTVR